MACNYFDYRDLVGKLFFGVPLTDKHLNQATEQLRMYLVNGGAGDVLSALGIGIRVVEKQFLLFPELNEIISRRFVYISGEHKGKELSVNEIKNIGLVLKHGPYYGKVKM